MLLQNLVALLDKHDAALLDLNIEQIWAADVDNYALHNVDRMLT